MLTNNLFSKLLKTIIISNLIILAISISLIFIFPGYENIIFLITVLVIFGLLALHTFLTINNYVQTSTPTKRLKETGLKLDISGDIIEEIINNPGHKIMIKLIDIPGYMELQYTNEPITIDDNIEDKQLLLFSNDELEECAKNGK